MANHVNVSSLPGVRQIEALYGFVQDVAERLKEVTASLGVVVETAAPEKTGQAVVPEKLSRVWRERFRARIRWHMKFLGKAAREEVQILKRQGHLAKAFERAKELSAPLRLKARREPTKRELGIAYRRMSPAQRLMKMRFMHLMQGLPANTRTKLRALRAEKGYAVAISAAKRENK